MCFDPHQYYIGLALCNVLDAEIRLEGEKSGVKYAQAKMESAHRVLQDARAELENVFRAAGLRSISGAARCPGAP